MPVENLKERLSNLYGNNSKHSHYQNIPEFVKESIGYSESINEEWRGDTARYKYILREVQDLKPKSICDIGANTGFFSLSLAHKFPEMKVTAFEGNPNHVEFMGLVKEAFSLKNIKIENCYIDYEGIKHLGQYDMLLNLNVLHHAGADFDENKTSYENVDAYLIQYLKRLITKAKKVVFQMGYNWGGDKSKPIVELQNDLGKIKYTHELFAQSGWKVQEIAHIVRNGTLEYKNYPEPFIQSLCTGERSEEAADVVNSQQLNMFSEFYRRPIFILQQ